MSKFTLAGSGELEIDDGAYNRKFIPGESFDLDESEIARIKRFGLSESFTAETAKAPAAPRKVAGRTEGGGE